MGYLKYDAYWFKSSKTWPALLFQEQPNVVNDETTELNKFSYI